MKSHKDEVYFVAFESMFIHASIGIIISDQKGRILRVNKKANQIFGYSDSELIGQSVEVLIPSDLREKHIRQRMEYNKTMEARPMGVGGNLIALKKEGSFFPVEISLASYVTEKGPEIVSFINDITARKQQEEALRRLTEELEDKVKERTEALFQAIQELQQLNDDLNREVECRKRVEEEARRAFEKEKDLGDLKTRFVSMASHEFRTPLSGILTSVSLIERYNELGQADKILKHVQTIKVSVHSLTSILNDFLSLDKLEEGRVESRASVLCLDDFCKNFIQEMRYLTRRGQTIEYDFDGQGDTVVVDKDLLKNVLINLMSNAIKYSGEGTQIVMSVRVLGNRFSISIQDQGIGISSQDQKHLFERFFRAENAVTFQGTGLGLNIVRRYLDLMHGEIEYTSVEHQGSTFTITLPTQ